MKHGITISLTVDASPGTFQLSTSEYPGLVYTISGYLYQGTEPHFFSSSDIVSGYIALDSFPKKPGQSVKGHFEAILRDNGGGTVEIKGHFNLESGSDGSYDCLK